MSIQASQSPNVSQSPIEGRLQRLPILRGWSAQTFFVYSTIQRYRRSLSIWFLSLHDDGSRKAHPMGERR